MNQSDSLINYEISIPAKIPSNILALLKKLEDYDKAGDSVCYWDRLDDLVILAKNAMAAGFLSKKDWNTLEERYWLKAELVCPGD